MDTQKNRLDSVLCYSGVFIASVATVLPWLLSWLFVDVVAKYVRSYGHSKPLPPFTEFLLALRPYCLGGALLVFIVLFFVGGGLVRFSAQTLRNSLIFALAALVLICFSFTFVTLSLVLPFVLLAG